MTDLKCPYCDLKKSVHIPDDVDPAELKMIKTCPCGRTMETKQEIAVRMKRRRIRKKVFYTLVRHKGKGKIIALRKKGIEFDKCGVTLYAYYDGRYAGTCYVIDPATGLSMASISHPLDVVYRYISHKMIEDLKHTKSYEDGAYYDRMQRDFQNAERVDELKEST